MAQRQDKMRPIQPFYVLDTAEFRQEVYRKQEISHFFSFKIEEERDVTTVPDGCIDLMFEYAAGGMRAYACGTVLKRGKQRWGRHAEVFGVRFMPGYLPAGLTAVPKDLIGKRLVLDDVVTDRRIIDRMAGAADFRQRIRVFLEEYTGLEKKRQAPFGKMELCMAVKDLVYESGGLVKVRELSERTGYTERYINNVFIELMGFSPKVFCKIIKFQRAVEYLNYGAPESMTQAAVDLGYYDQPKFIRDFKELAGLTPNQYLKLIQCKNYADRITENPDPLQTQK